MDKHVAVFREKESIEIALDVVRRLKEEAKSAYIDDPAPSSTRTCSVRSSWAPCSIRLKCACLGALHRTESRGAQFRTDFPERNDDEWLKHIDLTMNGDGPEICVFRRRRSPTGNRGELVRGTLFRTSMSDGEAGPREDLMATTRSSRRHKPEADDRGRQALLARLRGGPRPHPLGPRRSPPGQGPPRRLALPSGARAEPRSADPAASR